MDGALLFKTFYQNVIFFVRATSHLQLVNALGVNRPTKLKAIILCSPAVPFMIVRVKEAIPLLSYLAKRVNVP